MGAHVDRHVVDRNRKVGAVVEIVAAQEILVSFALAAMLGHDEARSGFEDLAGTRDRTCIEIGAGDGHLARHAGGRRGSSPDIGRAGRRCRRHRRRGRRRSDGRDRLRARLGAFR